MPARVRGSFDKHHVYCDPESEKVEKYCILLWRTRRGVVDQWGSAGTFDRRVCSTVLIGRDAGFQPPKGRRIFVTFRCQCRVAEQFSRSGAVAALEEATQSTRNEKVKPIG